MSSFSRQQLERWLSTITAKGKVLDIGGSQKPIEGRTKKYDTQDEHEQFPVFTILDLEQPHETERKPDIVADIQELLSLEIELQKYDQAFCIEVAEYWYNPIHALWNINQLLKKGGELFISFHFLYPIHNPEDQDYLRYTREGVRRLLKESGFEIEKIVPKHYANPQMIKMAYDNEGMKGVGKNSSEIHREQGWLITAIKM